MKRKDLLVHIIEDMILLRRKIAETRPNCDHSLTHVQIGILMMLEHEGGLNLKDIATRMRASSSAATQMVNGLVDSGYIVRKEDGEDRRKISLMLTERGRRKLDEAKEAHLAFFSDMVSPLSDDELVSLHSLQQKILERHGERKGS